MPIQYINTGTAPNQGNGDSLRLAFTKINNNFSLLADNSFTYNAVGEVIDHPELQRGISVTYNPLNQAASFLVNIAGPDTLGAVRIGGGITLNPDTGLISVFDGNYNNLTNIPQALGTTASPTFADLHVTGSLDIAGETTIINSSGIETANLNITLAKDATSESEANTAGIIVNGPESPASLRYTASDDSWNFNKRVNIPTLYVNGQFFSPGGLGDITVDLNVISTVNQDQDIILNPDGNGRIRLVNTPMQFDNGNNGVYSDHLIYTAPNAGKVGFGIGVSNNSPRIVGDGVTPGIVADFGIYAAGTGTWTSAVTVNSDGSLKAAGTIYQGIAYDGIDFPNTAIRVDANVDSYAELVMKNHNTGTNASTDLVIMNDQGTDTENFIDLGINSSNYSVTQYSSTQPNDGYLFVNGGNLVIGTQTPNKKIVFHAGGTRDIDSTAFFDEYAWQFNRPVTIDVDKPVPLNFTVINRSSNVVAQSLFQAVNNLGNLVHFGINSSHPEAFYGRIGPNEAFLHLENSTSTLHFGSYGDVVFYSDLANGFAGTPTLVMSSIDQSSTFAGHLLPTTDLTYDLGSTSSQWRSLYVGTSTVYFGGIPLRVTQEGGITINDIPVSGTGTVQPYLELTNTPFITQPVTLGTPVTAAADIRGQDALVEVVILPSEGPLLDSITVTSPGTGYVVGQRYRINYWQVGGNDDADNIDFEVGTVGPNGTLLTVVNETFQGTFTASNTPGTYSDTSIEYRPTEFDEVDTGLTLTRGIYGGLFNSETEFSYNSSESPIGTLWNADGWDTLVGFNTRTYGTFDSILTGPDNTPPGELIMWDTINDKYYKFAINIWGVDNNEFSYTRTLITDPNYFSKTNNGNEVDIIVEDDGDGAGIGITRDGNSGIYNPYRDEGWSSNVSPSGTLWNIDGWNDLTDIASRTYTNFYAAYGNGQLGNRVPGSKAVMYVPELGKYYAIEWLGWTQNNQGGGFSYTRREINLTKLDQGVRFADGTVQTTAYIPVDTNVISTAPGDRRIETASGYKQVAVTEKVYSNSLEAIASGSNVNNTWYVDVIKTTELTAFYNSQTPVSLEVSVNGTTWYSAYIGGISETTYQVIFNNGATFALDANDVINYRTYTGGDSVVWWDKDDLPGGATDFRGAIIDYHAYTSHGTIIGTIHIIDDDGDEYITHTEVSSADNDGSMYDNLWIVTSEGEIRYARVDGTAKTLKIHWTAKVFYGSDYSDD